ncbi:MAG: hypothetical protein AMJ90_01805 [candidate division Zixibacteria bacterium SM23_73_2]|nr:MAG: hypothetical protein AMJ90_01805 [candidate division Zixibacteria bacterium SM23_73_2]
MRLKDTGEFGLIQLFRKKFPSQNKKVVLGLGDDCAVIKASPQKLLLLTTDSLMEKVHFDTSYLTWEQIGKKSMAANISDMAAMGGEPISGLLSLGLPKRMETDYVLKLYSGINRMAKSFGFSISGGDIFLSDKVVITVSLLGEVKPSFLKKRSGAKEGDILCVTGELGESFAGLELLKKYRKLSRFPSDKKILDKHLNPLPRLKESRVLVKNLKVTSMIDISDGLLGDLYHILEESKVGAVLFEEKIPISKKISKISQHLKYSSLHYALNSGEEYELLFTIKKGNIESLKRLKIRISVIGEITNRVKRIEMIDKNGKVKALKKRGYEHF